MTISIYGQAMTRAARCLWAAEEVGVGYERKKINMFAGEHKAPDYLAINPNGKVPGFVDGDLVLFESMAINTYLADTYGNGSLQPDSAADRARANQWSHWVMAQCETQLLHGILHTFGLFGFEKSPEKVKEKRAELEAQLGVLNKALEGREYLVGNRFTIADLNVASVFRWGQMAGMDWAPHSNVAAWLGRCLTRPAAQKVDKMAQSDMAAANG